MIVISNPCRIWLAVQRIWFGFDNGFIRLKKLWRKRSWNSSKCVEQGNFSSSNLKYVKACLLNQTDRIQTEIRKTDEYNSVPAFWIHKKNVLWSYKYPPAVFPVSDVINSRNNIKPRELWSVDLVKSLLSSNNIEMFHPRNKLDSVIRYVCVCVQQQHVFNSETFVSFSLEVPSPSWLFQVILVFFFRIQGFYRAFSVYFFSEHCN